MFNKGRPIQLRPTMSMVGLTAIIGCSAAGVDPMPTFVVEPVCDEPVVAEPPQSLNPVLDSKTGEFGPQWNGPIVVPMTVSDEFDDLTLGAVLDGLEGWRMLTNNMVQFDVTVGPTVCNGANMVHASPLDNSCHLKCVPIDEHSSTCSVGMYVGNYGIVVDSEAGAGAYQITVHELGHTLKLKHTEGFMYYMVGRSENNWLDNRHYNKLAPRFGWDRTRLPQTRTYLDRVEMLGGYELERREAP